MKILVTGGSGFVGSHLLSELLRGGHEVLSLDWKEPQERFSQIKYFLQDFCDYDKVKKIFSEWKPEIVCHLGAIPGVFRSVEDPVPTMRSGVAGTYSVLEAARFAKVKRVVFASSCGAVLGSSCDEHSGKPLSEDLPAHPINPYGLSKKIGEDLVKMWAEEKLWQSVDAVSLRFLNVFGPRQSRDSAYATCVERFLHQWKNNEPFTIVPDGHQRRDIVYVGDVVRAVRLSAEYTGKFNGETINVGSGQNYSVLEIANFIGGADYPRVFIEQRPGEVRATLADISKAKKLLGWEPKTKIREGLEILKKSIKK